MSIKSYNDIYTVYAWQDNNRAFTVTTNEGGVKYIRLVLKDKQDTLDLSGNEVSVHYAATKPNGKEVLVTANKIDATNGKIEFPIESALTTNHGLVTGEVRVVTPLGVLKFHGINLNVHKGVSDKAAEQTEAFTALIDALRKLATIQEDGSVAVLDDIEEFDSGVNGRLNPMASGAVYEILKRYVLTDRTIAGLSLVENISVEQMQTALKHYPFILFTSEPTTSTKGKVGQFGGLIRYDSVTNKFTVKLYLCCSAGKTEGTYQWVLINDNTISDDQIASTLADYLDKHPIEGTGADGEDGVGIGATEINSNGDLVLTYTDGKIENVGKVVGANGKDGIGIKNIKINSNGELVITYTDDKEANVGRIVGVNGKNGVDGKDGYSPVLGVDYYTEEDKVEINALNIEFMTKELAKRGQLKPEFANTLEECTDISKLYVLPDGYIYGYTLTEIMSGGYENKSEPLPNNTTDTALWVKGYRIGSGGTPSAQDNTTLSNYITCTVGDVIRVKGVTFRDSNDRYALYKADNSTNGATYVSEPNASYATVNQTDDVYKFTIVKANTAFIRFAFQTPTDANSVVITVNEEIVEPTIATDYAWKNTNHAFVPNNYDEEFVDLNNQVLYLLNSLSEIKLSNQSLKQNLDNLSNEVENIGVTQIPDYWKPHLAEKIERISELQKLGGKDAFTFPVFADTHYTSNLGKIAPLLAKEIMDKVHSKFAVDVGDAQTRGCHANKEALEEENVLIGKMFEPVRDRLLRTEGNHDGAYGKLDKDGDGAISNHYSDGTVKPYNERETYVHNLTQAELFECIYRENGLAKDVHCDSSGTAYYVDDTLNKARFVVLNTHKNDYELNADGTQKYPKMWLFHYTQEQFDFLINEALKNGLTDEWAVMVFAHCPVTQEISDRELMQGVLRAFKNKTAYKGNYAGDFSYDAVSVDVDFSNAKGDFVGYFHGHNHVDSVDISCGFNVIGTRCDAKEENDSTLKAQRVQGTVTEQSFDVFTVNKAERKVYATKIGAGEDRTISY